MLHVIEHPTRHLFFTGKGGVDKTSLATATAVAEEHATRAAVVPMTAQPVGPDALQALARSASVLETV